MYLDDGVVLAVETINLKGKKLTNSIRKQTFLLLVERFYDFCYLTQQW